MTSNEPFVKVGQAHSHRDGGNQRCFLSESRLDFGKTRPAVYGKVRATVRKRRGEETGDKEEK